MSLSLQRKPALADDGDELTFCSTCAFSKVCLPHGFDKAQLRDLHACGAPSSAGCTLLWNKIYRRAQST